MSRNFRIAYKSCLFKLCKITHPFLINLSAYLSNGCHFENYTILTFSLKRVKRPTKTKKCRNFRALIYQSHFNFGRIKVCFEDGLDFTLLKTQTMMVATSQAGTRKTAPLLWFLPTKPALRLIPVLLGGICMKIFEFAFFWLLRLCGGAVVGAFFFLFCDFVESL